MTEKVIYFLIYWVAAGIILIVLKLFEDVNKKLKLKDWLPIFILAPIIFPLRVGLTKFTKAASATRPKKKER